MKSLTGHINENEIRKALEKKKAKKLELDLALIRLDELKNRINTLHKTIQMFDMELDWLGYERD